MNNMFFKSKAMNQILFDNDKLRKEIVETEERCRTIHKTRVELEERILELKSKRKIEEEDLKHMVKMREERLEIKFERKTIELEASHQEKLHKISNDYRDKSESFLKDRASGMETMYEKLLERLPDINVKLKGSV